MVVLSEPTREFISSEYVRLEVLPKSVFHGFEAESGFYEAFFEGTVSCLPYEALNLNDAFEEACRSGLSAIDAIHVSAAAQSGCHELITSEKPRAPIHRTRLVKTISIDTD